MVKLSSEGQENLDRLVVLLQARLSSNSKTKSKDTSGNTVYVDCDVFSKDSLACFLQLSLSEFNQTPYFTFFSFEDTKLIELVTDLLVEGAALNALASKALIERGREFKIENDGLYLDPPKMADLLQTQYSTLLRHHYDKLKYVKECINSFSNE